MSDLELPEAVGISHLAVGGISQEMATPINEPKLWEAAGRMVCDLPGLLPGDGNVRVEIVHRPGLGVGLQVNWETVCKGLPWQARQYISVPMLIDPRSRPENMVAMVRANLTKLRARHLAS